MEYLGGGHFGEVWRAEDTTTGRVVALKLIDPSDTTPDMAWQEATRLTSLESPHLVRVHGAALAIDVPYIDMALAEGGSTAKATSRLGTDEETALRWAQQVARGLQLCHVRGLVHRDVKPGNVLLNRVGHALLGDFGVAALMASDGTASEHGDAQVRAPEAFHGGSCTAVGDVYSLGVTLYYFLTGDYPHRWDDFGGSYDDFAAAVRAGTPDIRDVAPHVSRTLAAALRRALAVDPAARFQSAADLDRALSRVRARVRCIRRVDSHRADGMCWHMAEPAKGGKSIHVCCDPSGLRSVDLDVFYEQSGNRVREFCGSVTARQAPARLRAVFDHFG